MESREYSLKITEKENVPNWIGSVRMNHHIFYIDFVFLQIFKIKVWVSNCY